MLVRAGLPWTRSSLEINLRWNAGGRPGGRPRTKSRTKVRPTSSAVFAGGKTKGLGHLPSGLLAHLHHVIGRARRGIRLEPSRLLIVQHLEVIHQLPLRRDVLSGNLERSVTGFS